MTVDTFPVRPFRGPGTATLARTLLLTGAFAVLGEQGRAQSAPIQARFEPGCEEVTGFFTTPATAAAYTWDFGDGTTSTMPGPVHRFLFGTPVNVSLTLTDAGGGTTTFNESYAPHEQAELSELELPTIFTPNGDGLNETFSPTPDQFLGACAQLSILNRYGQLVFESLGNDLTWDGRTMAGEEVTAGTYFYVFDIKGMNFTGHITLVR